MRAILIGLIFFSLRAMALGGHFLAPNEYRPEQLRPILEAADSGAYVAVGTERGYMAAGLDSKITRLILIDQDKTSVEYNDVNIALLQASKGREDYLKLRLSKSFEDWKTAATRANLSAENRDILTDHFMFEFWQEKVAENREFNVFHRGPGVSDYALDYFKNANYLFSDENYARLKRLADQNQIMARLLDLSSPLQIHTLGQDLNQAGFKLSVLDISNAWWDKYLAREGFITMMRSLQAFCNPNTLMVLTDLGLGQSYYEFQYMGFRYFDILKIGVNRFYSRLQKQHETVRNVPPTLYFKASITGVGINEIAKPNFFVRFCKTLLSRLIRITSLTPEVQQ